MFGVNKEKIIHLSVPIFLLLFLVSILCSVSACTNQNSKYHPDPSEFARGLSSSAHYLNSEPKALIKKPESEHYKIASENTPVEDLISHDFSADHSEFPYFRSWGDEMDYTEEYSFTEGIYPMIDSSGKWGYVDDSYNWIVKAQYDSAESFRNGYGLVSIKDKDQKSTRILIDKKGSQILTIDKDVRGFPTNILTDNPHKSPKEQYKSLLKLFNKYPDMNIFYYAGSNVFGYGVNYDSMEGKGLIGYIDINFEEIISPMKDKKMFFFDQGIASIDDYDDDQLYVTNKGYLLDKDQIVEYLGFDNSRNTEPIEQSRGLRKILNIQGFMSTPFLLGEYRQLTDTVFYKSSGGSCAEEGSPSLCLVDSEGNKIDCDFNKTDTFPTTAFRINKRVRIIPHSYGGENPSGESVVVYDEKGNKLFSIATKELINLRYLAPDRWFVYEQHDGTILNARLINEQGKTIYHINM